MKEIYKLSCCEKCLLEEFKDYPPKTRTLMFSRGQRWSKFVYNVPEDVAARLRSNTVAVTLESMIRKHGEEEGRKRWEHYCNAQSISNTFEYKQEKLGWTKEEFDNYNKSRAVTLENLQNKYGEKEGKRRFEEYCERQRYTTSLEYMIEEYGEVEGKNKFDAFCEGRAKGGWSNSKKYSDISQLLFKLVKDNLDLNDIDTSEIYYETNNKELYIRDYKNKIGYMPDFFDKKRNLIIEFQGDYWHANSEVFPQFLDENFYVEQKEKTVKEIHDHDDQKEAFFKSEYPGVIYIRVWEHDFKNNPDKVLGDILQYYGMTLE